MLIRHASEVSVHNFGFVGQFAVGGIKYGASQRTRHQNFKPFFCAVEFNLAKAKLELNGQNKANRYNIAC